MTAAGWLVVRVWQHETLKPRLTELEIEKEISRKAVAYFAQEMDR